MLFEVVSIVGGNFGAWGHNKSNKKLDEHKGDKHPAVVSDAGPMFLVWGTYCGPAIANVRDRADVPQASHVVALFGA